MGRDTFASTSARLQSNVVKALTGYFRLKDFIHAVRACKTQAEERTLVARESAAIRTSFKEDVSSDQLYHAIAKILFIYMMGFPAHFGQVESLKMVALPRMAEKRLGYLGSTQLMDEQQPTLTLITNSIKSDLNSPSNSIVALALANLALTASSDIARDLADEVERLLSSSTPYIRKKAAFCASRLIWRVPELAEQFEGRAQSLLGDRDHAVVLGGISLAMQLCQIDAMFVVKFRKVLVPIVIRQLQSIIAGGYSADYDVSGISDPVLQVRLLRLLRVLGEGDGETSEAMTDILTQISTSTDPAKNVGHAVLYEAAVTIMNIESDPALRTMAINILGRLLSTTHSSDNNLRYVALTLLNKIISAGVEGLSAVQRHRAVILDCLHDPDVSIRRRAVDLAVALCSSDTIRNVTNELLELLDQQQLRTLATTADEVELRQSIVTRLAIAVAQFAPSAKWYVDTMIRLLAHIDSGASLPYATMASRKEEIVSTFVRIINNTHELHRYASERLYRAVVLGETTISSLGADAPPLRITEAMVQATVWCIGEFGDLLVSMRLAGDEQLVLLLEQWATDPAGALGTEPSSACLGYIISALGKLSNRLAARGKLINSISRALNAIAELRVNQHDLHYRAREMEMLVNNATLRATLLAKMPADAAGDRLGHVSSRGKVGSRLASAAAVGGPLSDGATSPLGTPQVSPTPEALFAELATLSLDGATSADVGASPLKRPKRGTVVFEGEHIKVYVSLIEDEKDKAAVTITKTIRVEMENISREGGLIEKVLLQCAVPKSMRLQMQPASSTTIYDRDAIEQLLQVTPADPQAKIKLRMKLSYQTAVGEEIFHQFDVSNLESTSAS